MNEWNDGRFACYNLIGIVYTQRNYFRVKLTIQFSSARILSYSLCAQFDLKFKLTDIDMRNILMKSFPQMKTTTQRAQAKTVLELICISVVERNKSETKFNTDKGRWN